MNRFDALKMLDRKLSGTGEDIDRQVSGTGEDIKLSGTGEDIKDPSGDIVGELRRTSREMELNASCVTAMRQVLESRRSLPKDEWLELVGLVRLRIEALTRSAA